MEKTPEQLEQMRVNINGFDFYPNEISKQYDCNSRALVTDYIRNSIGAVPNINDILAFYTPLLTLDFQYMTESTWQKMRLARSATAVPISYYDHDYGKRVTYQMINTTKDEPNYFTEAIGREPFIDGTKTFTFVGSNNDLRNLTISYNKNSTPEQQVTQTVRPNEFFYVKGNDTFTRDGYNITKWNTKADGSGIDYSNGMGITTTQNITLYAVWQETPSRNINFYYQGIKQQPLDDEDSNWVSNKAVNIGEAVGALPLPRMYITENEALKQVGTLIGWWNLPYDWKSHGQNHEEWLKDEIATATEGSIVQYTASTIYNINGDITIYAHWKPNMYIVSYNSNGGSSVASESVAFMNKITKPSNPTKSGYSFGGWYSDSGLTKSFTNWNMNYSNNITLYAKWVSEV